jgi:hypothetical protein
MYFMRRGNNNEGNWGYIWAYGITFCPSGIYISLIPTPSVIGSYQTWCCCFGPRLTNGIIVKVKGGSQSSVCLTSQASPVNGRTQRMGTRWCTPADQGRDQAQWGITDLRGRGGIPELVAEGVTLNLPPLRCGIMFLKPPADCSVRV